MNWKEWASPSPEQQAQFLRVEKAFTDEANLLDREGIPLPVIIAGMAAAVSDVLVATTGPDHVADWFQKQADMIRELQRGGH